MFQGLAVAVVLAHAASPVDVVEVIDLGDGGAAVDEHEREHTHAGERDDSDVRVRGSSRTLVSTGPYRYGQYGDDTNVPYDQLRLEQQLHLRLRYARGGTFEAVVEGVIAVSLSEQDAPRGVDWNGANGVESRGRFDAELREAYVGRFWRRFDLRIGQQRIAWGRSDTIAPNDVVNPRDLRDPFLVDTELARLPVPALRGDLALGDAATAQLVIVPFHVPDRWAGYGENWSTIQPDAPLPVRGLFGLTRDLDDPAIDEALAPLLRRSGDRSPELDLSRAQAGGRIEWNGDRVDVSAIYWNGWAPVPMLSVDPGFATRMSRYDWARATAGDVEPLLDELRDGARPFRAEHVRRHHAGADVTAVAGPFVLRAEAAWDSAQVFTRSDLTGVALPAVQGVLGVEYQPGELGKIVLVELWAQTLLDDPGGELLGAREDMLAVASLFRWRFGDHLDLDARLHVGVVPFELAARPQIGWTQGAFSLRVGALLLGGDRGTTTHYYRRNQTVYAMVRWRF